MLALSERCKPKVRYFNRRGLRIKNTTIPSWIYEKPLPDFIKLFQEADVVQKARFFTFLHKARELKKQGMW